MVRNFFLVGLVLSSVCWGGELVLRDARTGFGVSGQVVLRDLAEPVAPLASLIDELLADRDAVSIVHVDRSLSLDLTGPAAVRVDAEGYRPFHSVLRPGPDNRGWTLMLDPTDDEPVPLADSDSALLISGWVTSVDSFGPIAGATVRVDHAVAEAVTDASGYYELEVPAPTIVNDRPVPISIRFSAPGWSDYRFIDQLAGAGGLRANATLGASPPLPRGHRQLGNGWAESGDDTIARLKLDSRGAAGDEPPASITVGFADAGCSQRCCTGGCPHSCSFSLEEYTRRGLPKEWIASWQFDALAAGAVAYRSYGAWHVFNPPAHGAYDVCSSACCQVNEPGTLASTNAATAATAGLMLVRSGGIFRSEYSAQNNSLLGALSCVNADLSCGNGFAGSPAAGWPCLADPVSVDQACFGHGRGMSQWGNQYWAQASPIQRWKWQLNHYYNDNGAGTGLRTAAISQVLVIDEVRVLPDQAVGGARIVFELDVINLGSENHADVLIGASLRQPPGPFINDPANDQPVVLPPGPSSVSRYFDLPAGLTDGPYDVYASLYIDVDRNQIISATDLAQQLYIVAGGLLVQEGVFADRFEVP